MEKAMNTNKMTIIGSIIAILLIVLIPTIYKVIKNHYDNLYQVVEEKIISSAKKCYYEEKCLDENITLKELYALDYLEKVSNPISKEYYNEESYIKRAGNDFRFVVVE